MQGHHHHHTQSDLSFQEGASSDSLVRVMSER